MAGLGIGMLLGARAVPLPSRPVYDAATRTASGRAPPGAVVTVLLNGAAAGSVEANAQGRWSHAFATSPARGQTIAARTEVTSPGRIVVSGPDAAAAPLSIHGAPGAAMVGTPYAWRPIVDGGSGARTFALAGVLPAGLSVSTTTGAITGTPTAPGTASGLAITVTDAGGTALLAPRSITVQAAPAKINVANLLFAHGARKMVEGYAGPALDVTSGGTTTTIGFVGEGVDLPAIAAAQGAEAAVRVPRVYDQSGAGRHQTSTVSPSISAHLAYEGRQPILFDSIQSDKAASQCLTAEGLTLDRQNHTYFLVLNPTVGWRQRNRWFNMFAGGNALRAAMGTTVATSGNYQNQKGTILNDGTNTLFTNAPLRSMPIVVAVRSSASGRKIWWGDQTYTAPALTAGTIVTHEIGMQLGFTSALLNLRAHVFGDAAYSVAKSDAEIEAIKAALEAIYGCRTGFGRRLILAGDSNQEGFSVLQARSLANILQQERLLTHGWEVFNVGVSGRTMASMANATGGTTAASASYEYIELIRPGQNDVVVVNAGVNDLGARSGADVHADAQTIAGLIRTAGGIPVFETVPPRGDWAEGGGPDGNRLHYNALQRANPAGDHLIDTAMDPELGAYSAPAGPFFGADRLHYTAAGNLRRATALYGPKLNAIAA